MSSGDATQWQRGFAVIPIAELEIRPDTHCKDGEVRFFRSTGDKKNPVASRVVLDHRMIGRMIRGVLCHPECRARCPQLYVAPLSQLTVHDIGNAQTNAVDQVAAIAEAVRRLAAHCGFNLPTIQSDIMFNGGSLQIGKVTVRYNYDQSILEIANVAGGSKGRGAVDVRFEELVIICALFVGDDAMELIDAGLKFPALAQIAAGEDGATLGSILALPASGNGASGDGNDSNSEDDGNSCDGDASGDAADPEGAPESGSQHRNGDQASDVSEPSDVVAGDSTGHEGAESSGDDPATMLSGLLAHLEIVIKLLGRVVGDEQASQWHDLLTALPAQLSAIVKRMREKGVNAADLPSLDDLARQQQQLADRDRALQATAEELTAQRAELDSRATALSAEADALAALANSLAGGLAPASELIATTLSLLGEMKARLSSGTSATGGSR